MQSYREQNRIQYFADILILTGLVLLSATVFGFLALMLCSAVYGMDFQSAMSALRGSAEGAGSGFLRLYNSVSTFGAWVVSVFLFTRIRNMGFNTLCDFRKPVIPRLWLFILPVSASALLIAAFLFEINGRIPFPESLVSAFDSYNTSGLLGRMLEMNGPAQLLLNLLVIALLPAVFEEIFFRGSLQPLMAGLFRNHHAAIWLTGLVFALIHLNIHQILPMMFLALLLGYMRHYSGSILPGIVLHLLNNGIAVLAYYFQDSSSLAGKIVNDQLSPGLPVFAVSLAVLLLIFVYIIQQFKLRKHE